MGALCEPFIVKKPDIIFVEGTGVILLHDPAVWLDQGSGTFYGLPLAPSSCVPSEVQDGRE
jgi:hypothetical protein